MKIGTTNPFFKNLVIKVTSIIAVILLFTSCGGPSISGTFINSSRSYSDFAVLEFHDNGKIYVDGVKGTYKITGKAVTIKKGISEISGEMKDDTTIVIDGDNFFKVK